MIDDAETCRRKMVAASTLINGLGGEKERWTEQSKEFHEQTERFGSPFNVHDSLNGFLDTSCLFKIFES